MEGTNVEYRRENAMVTMKIRRPYTTASMWSSGKLTVTGATSEPDSRIAARRFSRKLQRLGYKVRLANFRVVNVLATCRMPFAIRIAQFSQAHRANASYEPELHPGVTYKIKEIKAVLKIFSTGSITVTAPSVSNVEMAIHQIFPLVVEHQMEKLKVKDKFELNVHKHNIVAGRKRKHRGGALPRQLKKSRTNEGTSLSECDTDSDCDSGDSFDSNESAD
ncbi:PREDICTED: TATA box-binding protein-like protein 1 isoform X2 [Priapulus caudatus]|nr:PREDICTED: TATA box-binding protein-like protein 1 isoform X2 [Priapulus caudatus]